MKHIIYASNSIIPSKSANSIHVCKMAQSLAKLGPKVTLLGIRPHARALGTDTEFAKFYGVKKDFGLQTFRMRRGLKGLDYLFQLKRYIRKSKPDVVYVRSVNIALEMTKLNIPVIFECHGDIENNEHNDFIDLLDSKLLLTVVVISEALKSILLSKYGDKLGRHLIVAHDGVDISRFADNGLPPAHYRHILGLPERDTACYSGHFYKGRGIELILDLAAIHRTTNFLLVGGNPDDVSRYRAISEARKLQNTIFTGFVPNGELPDYLKAADVLLMPYQKKVSISGNRGDTASWMSPLKMFEYMATLRPIISSDLAVLHEVLDEQQCIFCAPDDVAGWSRAISRLISDGALADNLARNAYRNVQHYEWDRRAKCIMERAALCLN
ncbi:Putative teichuronic acid biosynthesis glycosyltransferase TuaC (plasmid) [Sulfitobacter indolifex]|uniref:glycosyltransferase family 4 protein n=1 Tax=Sulfitobacter indolifex TaxID=225422 RepID=UPI001FAE2A32|nr:glycosyltransferase family 4 protein [Sulfitobacter indolifex]UOA20690.1 Putative teichuronic acid biosynthesis glycosyltransferase TuaC [Sulfitobacter indolifex]